jgi:hypothetical protein
MRGGALHHLSFFGFDFVLTLLATIPAKVDNVCIQKKYANKKAKIIQRIYEKCTGYHSGRWTGKQTISPH